MLTNEFLNFAKNIPNVNFWRLRHLFNDHLLLNLIKGANCPEAKTKNEGVVGWADSDEPNCRTNQKETCIGIHSTLETIPLPEIKVWPKVLRQNSGCFGTCPFQKYFFSLQGCEISCRSSECLCLSEPHLKKQFLLWFAAWKPERNHQRFSQRTQRPNCRHVTFLFSVLVLKNTQKCPLTLTDVRLLL